MVFTTGRFMSSYLALCSSVVVVFFFSVLFSIVIRLLGKERAGLCASRAFVYFARMSFFYSSWCQGFDCGL